MQEFIDKFLNGKSQKSYYIPRKIHLFIDEYSKTNKETQATSLISHLNFNKIIESSQSMPEHLRFTLEELEAMSE